MVIFHSYVSLPEGNHLDANVRVAKVAKAMKMANTNVFLGRSQVVISSAG
jgi:hypothetical protein